MVAAAAYFFNKQLDLYEREAQQAMELAPNDAEILATLACMIAEHGAVATRGDIGEEGKRAKC